MSEESTEKLIVRIAVLEEKVETLTKKIDNLNSGINRGLWIIGGGFITSIVAWIVSGGLYFGPK